MVPKIMPQVVFNQHYSQLMSDSYEVIPAQYCLNVLARGSPKISWDFLDMLRDTTDFAMILWTP